MAINKNWWSVTSKQHAYSSKRVYGKQVYGKRVYGKRVYWGSTLKTE